MQLSFVHNSSALMIRYESQKFNDKNTFENILDVTIKVPNVDSIIT